MSAATIDFSKETRAKFFDMMEAHNHRGIAIMKGLPTAIRIDSDREELFRQDSNFFYLTGVNEPDCWAVFDLSHRRYHLFVPKIPDDCKVWMTVIPMEGKNELYNPDDIHTTSELKNVIAETVKDMIPDSKVFLMSYYRDEDMPALGLPASVHIDTEVLREIIHECRVLKTPAEIIILREASRIDSAAYRAVMKAMRPGMMEYDVEALWQYETYRRGGPNAKLIAYNTIAASGKSAATLHYPDNNKPLRDGDIFLLDAGNEYRNYASDITRTFPVNGRFSSKQRLIYEIVLKAHKAVIEHMRPGVDWTDMHRLSMRIIGEGLLEAGFLRGSIDDILRHHVVALFYMHGLGHQLGIDVHDVGGYPKGVERIQEPGIRSLRTRRILAPGMVLTVEPGVYFKDALLEPALADPKMKPFLNEERIREFWDFGGIRIEDDVLVTETGHESLTDVPKEIADIEALMAHPVHHPRAPIEEP